MVMVMVMVMVRVRVRVKTNLLEIGGNAGVKTHMHRVGYAFIHKKIQAVFFLTLNKTPLRSDYELDVATAIATDDLHCCE